ncbi:MAG TPA: hypothetical protein VMJ34_16125 [Bryobacteraceae bacterium]|nr:hypothetical protein [Bryobacteraceae bacterium]
MGANPTQAQAVTLFLIGFTLISVGLAQAYGVISLILGVIALGLSVTLFLKCKPWETKAD